MAIEYTITEVNGDLITVVFPDESWAQVRVSADMTQENVDDLVYQFAPKSIGQGPAFLQPGETRQAAPAPEPEPPVLTPEEQLAAERAAMVCSPLQGRLALRQVGMFDQVQAAIAAADDTTKDAFEYAVEWRRTSPMMVSLAAAIGLGETQMDDLFRTAMAIRV